MTDNNNYRPLRSRGFAALVAIHIAIAAVLTLLCLGCSRKAVPVATAPVVLHDASVRADTVLRTRLVRDTLWRRDSVFVAVNTFMRGDTVFVERDRVRYAETSARSLRRDTVWRTRTDSLRKEIPVPYEVEKVVEKERKPPWTERVRLAAFPWLCVAVAALGAWTFRRPLWRLLRRIMGK